MTPPPTSGSSTATPAIGFYERHGFAFDGAAKPEDVGLERRMVRR